MKRLSVVACLLAMAACTPAAQRPTVKAAAVALERFDSCPELLTHLRGEARKLVGPYGLGGGVHMLRDGTTSMLQPQRAAAPSAAAQEDATGGPQAGVDYSQTNVQEAGVDEPDLVKTDGKRIFAITQSRLRAIDVTSGTPRLAGSIEMPGGFATELLLAGDRALVMGAAAQGGVPGPQPRPMVAEDSIAPWYGSGKTLVHVVDVSDPGAMRIVSTLTLDGAYAAARMHGGIARLVLRGEQLARMQFKAPADGSARAVQAASDANRSIVDKSTIKDWLPRFSITSGGKTSEGELATCESTYRPTAFSGLGMVTVVTIDPRDPSPDKGASVVASAETVYASARTLYVATSKWSVVAPVADEVASVSSTTELHSFDITDPKRARYTASGSVPGRLLNQWSISEHDGHLRVATTVDAAQASESAVLVLKATGQTLAQVGRVGGLGLGERIYTVRFMGPVGFVVTFRQVDPLYTLDLRDPAKPRVTGELKIPGYSAYLHPIADGYLLGVGQDATDEGRVQGMQVSVFDVRDPAKPARVHQHKIGLGAHSEAEHDHKAFLWWAASKLAVLPMQSWSPNEAPFAGAVALQVDVHDGIREVGRLSHRQVAPIRRSLVVGNTLYTVSDAGLLASDAGSLAQRAWLAFA